MRRENGAAHQNGASRGAINDVRRIVENQEMTAYQSKAKKAK